MGEDQPRPGISAVHATLSFVDQCVGRLDASATPALSGPRNWGQFTAVSPRAPAAGREIASARARRRVLIQPILADRKVRVALLRVLRGLLVLRFLGAGRFGYRSAEQALDPRTQRLDESIPQQRPDRGPDVRR